MRDIPAFFFRGISWFQLDLPLAISPCFCFSKCYCLLSLTTSSAYALLGSCLAVFVQCLHAFALLRGIAIPSAHLIVSRQEKTIYQHECFCCVLPSQLIDPLPAFVVPSACSLSVYLPHCLLNCYCSFHKQACPSEELFGSK